MYVSCVSVCLCNMKEDKTGECLSQKNAAPFCWGGVGNLLDNNSILELVLAIYKSASLLLNDHSFFSDIYFNADVLHVVHKTDRKNTVYKALLSVQGCELAHNRNTGWQSVY